MDIEKMLPALAAFVAVFGLGYINFKLLRTKDEKGIITENVNYMYLAIAAFVAAAGFTMFQDTDFYYSL